jgi:signal peptidase I
MMNDEQGGLDEAPTEAAAEATTATPASANITTPASANTGTPAEATTATPASATTAVPASAPAAETEEPRRARSFWRELPVLFVVALVIALVIKSFVVQAFYIPSSSMENTINIGDKVLVNKLVYHFRAIAPGDIIVFNGAGSWDPVPSATTNSNPVVRTYDVTLRPLLHSIAGLFGTAPGQTDFIKRVIGVPGDHVACCTAQGLVTVNGVPLDEKSYLYPDDAPGTTPSATESFSITVPPGRLWVMGDHRSVSDDSRLRRGDPGGGTIPENEVIGRAFMIVWPASRWRILPIPSTFGQPGIGSASANVSAPVDLAAPYLPMESGFALAVPVTWLLRRIRRRGRPRGDS